MSEKSRNTSDGTRRETMEMEAPVYEVDVPGIGTVWFEDDYHGAFQNATGETMEAAGDDHPQESEIRIVDFEGIREVPVANV